MQNTASVMPIGGAFDIISATSSRPGTTSNSYALRNPGGTGASGVRKVQSSALAVSSKQTRPSEPKLQGDKFVGGGRLNENSGQLHHVPKGFNSNQGERQ